MAAWIGAPPELRKRRLLAVAGGFIVPFLPYVASQGLSGWPDWMGATSYIERRVGLGNVVGWPSLAWGVLWGGPEVIGRYVAGWGAALVTALCVIGIFAAALPLAALALPRVAAEGRRAIVGAALAFGAFSLWVALLRPVTPFYFVLVLPPIVAALLAATLWIGWRARSLRPVVGVACMLTIAIHVAVTRDMARKVRAGDGVLPARVADVRDSSYAHTFSDVWFPAIAREGLGRALCAHRDGLTLHGQLAYLVDRSLGVDALFACGRRDFVALGNGELGRGEHLTGLTRRFWSALDAAPDCWIGSMGVARARPLAGSGSLAVADGSIYPPRLASRQPARELALAFEASRSEAVVVANVTPGYQDVEVVSVSVDGAELQAVATDDVARAYVAPREGTATARWRLTIRANEPAATDVVALERSRVRRRAAACR